MTALERRDYEEKVREIQGHSPINDVPHGWNPSAKTIEAIQNTSDVSGETEWINRGIQDVSLDQVDLSDSHVRGSSDFLKTSKDEMVEGFRKLEEEVRPAVEQGADRDYFTALDQQQGLEHRHGYRQVYDAFYGKRSIKLEKPIDGDKYIVSDGNHRLSVARELGLKTVPAQVKEEVRR